MTDGGDWGTPDWYAEMSDQQLQTTLMGLPPYSREWGIVKRQIDARAVIRRGNRNLWIFMGAVAVVTLALGVFVFLMAE